LLILLPVALLCGTGAYALVRDRALAEHEATQRAQAVADDVLRQLWPRLVNPELLGTAGMFQVDSNGSLTYPPPYVRIPDPQPLDPTHLNPTQQALWRAVLAPGDERSGGPGEEALRSFLQTDPPAQFAAVAEYTLGLHLLRSGDRTASGEAFKTVATQYSSATSESGLALGPLAQLKVFETLPSAKGPARLLELDNLCSNLVHAPGPITPVLLGRIRDAVADLEPSRAFESTNAPSLTRPFKIPRQSQRSVVDSWISAWDQHEQIRKRFAAERRIGTSAIWLTGKMDEDSRGPWLAFPLKSRPGWFICREELEVGELLSEVATESRQIPEYFGLGLEIAGRAIRRHAPDLHQWGYRDHTAKGASGPRKTQDLERTGRLLATATPVAGGGDGVWLGVYLTSSDALFKQQQARAFWFGSLLVAAGTSAVVGFFAAYRAFRRQLRLSELKSNFVSSVSHELRAPIASVRLMSESLDRGTIPDESRRREYFRFIVQECRRLSALVENVLDFSRIEQGRKEYEFEPTDVMELTRQTVKLMEPAATEREVALGLVLPESPGPATQPCVDGRAVQQALVNLVDNALKHSPRGSTVTVGLEEANGNGMVRLWVDDNGPGIPLEEQERIFERFYRCGSELTRQTQGVGIGLSIVKHIAEAHGGRVMIRSAPGKGSRFTLELPQQQPMSSDSLR
jgi:signal transduction histidine kinase